MGSVCTKKSIREQIKEEMFLLSTENNYKINKIQEENEYLKKVNITLENQIATLKSNSDSENGLSLTSLSSKNIKILSEKKINEYIENILKNPDTNISWLPDIVEKKIYKNIITLSLNVLETTIENSNIELLGHKINFVLDPIIK